MFHLRIEMLSDWRIGSGVGRQGAVDSLVVRDVHDLPYVPSTTLRGMWRDAAEQLAYGLDGGPSGDFATLVNRLFGSQPIDKPCDGPVSSLLSVGDARFPDELGAYLKGAKDKAKDKQGTKAPDRQDKPAARQAFTFVKSGVAIDPESGRATDDFLRFDETARAGALLDARVDIKATGSTEFDALSRDFALAALRLIERIGGDRRRGAGRCRVDLVVDGKATQTPIDDAIERLSKSIDSGEAKTALATSKEPAARAPSAPEQGEPQAYDAPSGIEGAHRLSLEVELIAPTTIVERTEGNVISTLDHAPGTMLIPAAAELLGLEPTSEAFARALGAGRLRVRAAYPGRDNTRAAPAPIVFDQLKDPKSGKDKPGPAEPSTEPPSPRKMPGDVKNRLHESPPKPCDPQRKPIRAGYCLTDLGDGLMLAKSPKPKLRTQNAVDDQRQKPTAETGGGVYVAEVLAPGTKLYAELLIDVSLIGPGRLLAQNALAARVNRSATARLGRGKAAGFGAARVTVTAHHPPGPPAAETLSEADAPGSREIILLVASDLVLPADADPSPRIALQEMLAEAGITGTICDRSDLRFHRIDGWVTAWGLQRPTLTAIAAGSVIVVCNAAASKAALARLAVDGLGMRRGEGFGEIVVDPPILRKGAQLNPKSTDQSQPREPLKHAPYSRSHLDDFLKAVERAAVLEVVRMFAERAAQDEKVRCGKLGWTSGREAKPPMTQLGNIRARIDPAAEAPDFGRALAYLTDVDKVDRRKTSWGSHDAIETLHKLFESVAKTSDAKIWEILRGVDQTAFAFDQALEQALILSTVAQAKKEFAAKATAEFLYAAIRQHKRAGEPARPNRSKEPA